MCLNRKAFYDAARRPAKSFPGRESGDSSANASALREDGRRLLRFKLDASDIEGNGRRKQGGRRRHLAGYGGEPLTIGEAKMKRRVGCAFAGFTLIELLVVVA